MVMRLFAALLGAGLLLGGSTVQAEGCPETLLPPPPPDCRPHPPLPGPEHHRMRAMPQLTGEQQTQLDQLLQKERDHAAGILQKMEENRHALRQAADREPFDEAAVTALAKLQSELQTELLLSHLRTQARIRSLFPPPRNQ
ncbi:periplasmic heavy metal sensor [Trichlorobacter lovleyi]|uniref:periplasmic heavy metal sensor n=1 Tax=Trichlorobacter lovleyi TaxID=313985 RepID=UPI002FDEDF95